MTLSSTQLQALKTACSNLIEYNGGCAAVADKTRVGASALYNYTNRNNATCFAPLDIIYELESAAGTYPVTHALCRAHGIIPITIKTSDDHSAIAQSIAKIAKEQSDIFEKTALAMADGTLTPREAASILPEINDSISALLEFETLVRSVADSMPDALAVSAQSLRGEVLQ